ncbi:TolC family protein [Colwellia psychrerythraea]|uniref:Outer membrane efflux protein n=1 Tax=Colwellia psychrerythraea TaxID=28229 RepID=A0A099KPI6_COLPS|nr:TolC family protein [Colwellia psychrerythraea]KGJ91548.1 outer membrane efflux protein [Colwellia psychrerythraea]
MKFYPLFLSVISALLISACSTFEDVTYDTQANNQLTNLANTKIDFSNEPAAMPLTDLLSIKEVDALIENALTNNPSLQQTLLTLKKAREKVTVSSSAQWPSMSAGVNASNSENNSASYSGSLDVAWTADIWQQLANANQAQEADFSASVYAYQGAKDLLVAKVMQAYLNLVRLTQLTNIEDKRVTTYKKNGKVIIDRYRKGLILLNELDTAKSTTRSSQANLVDYQNQYQEALRNLSLLTGVAKNQLSYQASFPEVVIPVNEIDASSIGRRPDLQQAYQNILSSQYLHKVAYKALLPSLTLSGSINSNDNNLHDALFGSSAWQLLGQISAPIFNAGKLNSEAEIAKLSAEQSYWAFQEELLSAVNEVDNAIAQDDAISKRLNLTKLALESALRSEVTYTSRYRQGTVSLLDLLQIQQQTFSLQAQVTQLTYEQLNNRITLGLALGLGL